MNPNSPFLFHEIHLTINIVMMGVDSAELLKSIPLGWDRIVCWDGEHVLEGDLFAGKHQSFKGFA